MEKKQLNTLKYFFFLIAILGLSTLIWAEEPSLTVLPNGVRIITKEIHRTPLVNVVSMVKAGVITEGESLNGASHYLEHLLLFRGTKLFPPAKLGHIIENNGGYFNGHTSYDKTTFEITLPSSLLDLALLIQSEVIFEGNFGGEEFEIEKKAVEEEYRRSIETPWGDTYASIRPYIFPKGHPYSLTILGPIEKIKSLTVKDVYQYYKKYYVPNNLSIIITGDFNKKSAIDLVKKHFEKYQQKPLPPIIPDKREMPRNITVIQKESPYPHTYMLMATQAPAGSDKSTYAVDILSYILSSSADSILIRKLREGLELVLSIETSYVTHFMKCPFFIEAQLEPDNLLPTIKETMVLLNEIREGKFSEERFERSKTAFLYDLIHQGEDPFEEANTLAFWEGAVDYTFSLTYEDNIRKVTPSDITQAAREVFSPDRFVIFVLHPKGKAIPNLEEEVKKIALPYSQKTLTPIPINKRVNESAGISASLISEEPLSGVIKKTPLPNGVTVFTRCEPSRIASLRLFVRIGSLDLWACNLLSKVILRGAGDMGGFQISQFFQDYGIYFNVWADRDYFHLCAKMPRENFEKGLKILSDVALKPHLLEIELEAVKPRQIAQIKARYNEAYEIVPETMEQEAFNGHPYSQLELGTVEGITNFTRDELIKLHKTLFSPQNIILAYCGEIKDEDIVKKITQYFGDIKPDNTPPPLPQLDKLPTPKHITLSRPDSKQAVIYLGWRIPPPRNKDAVPLMLLSSILGDSTASRLWKLRHEQGLAYAVSSYLKNYCEGGLFIVDIGTEPSNKEKAISLILQEIKKLREEDVSPEELLNAKQRIYGTYLRNRKLTSDLTWYMGINAILGHPVEYDKKLPEMVQAVTINDIKRVATEYLSEKDYFLVIYGPYQ